MVFVDANVLVYARDARDARKQARAFAWMEHLWRTGSGRLSTQILHEFYVTVTRKLKPGLDRETARDEVRALQAWRPVSIDGSVLAGAWHLEDVASLSLWDALVVSAAQHARCEILLTEDLQHDRAFGSVRVVDPFRRAPG